MQTLVARRLLVDLPANAAASTTGDGSPSLAEIVRCAVTARFVAVFLHRAAVASRAVPLLPLVLKQVNQFLTGADISPEAVVGPGAVLYHPNGVVIGSGARIGARVVVQQGVTVGGLGGPRRDRPAETVIGDDVFLGAGCRIIGAIRVDDGCIVGANAVVTKDVPAWSVAVGIPARSHPRDDVPAAAGTDGTLKQ